jgi:hypothetical protein
MNIFETKPKTIFYISCDYFAPRMTIVLSIHAFHLRRPMNSQKHGWQFEKNISIKKNQQELNFLKRYLVITQICNSLKVCLSRTIKWRRETTKWILQAGLHGCGDYGAIDWKITINDFSEEGKSVKSSSEEKSNNSMKKKMQEHMNIEGECWESRALLSQSWQENLSFLAWKWCLKSCDSNYH